MKKISFIVIFLSIFMTTTAQTAVTDLKEVKDHRMGLEFSAGYAVALSSYWMFESGQKKSGYATNGFQVQVGFDWIGKKNFGMAIQYTFQRNPLENGSNPLYLKGIPDSIGSGYWSNHFLMMGPVFMQTIKRIHIDAKILGGVIVSASTNFNTPDPNDTVGIRYNKNTGTGFAYQISAGVGYTISSHLTFKFNLSLVGGWPGARKQYYSQLIGYEEIYDPLTGLTYYKPIYSAPVNYEIKAAFTTLNPSVGLVFRF